MLLLMAIRRRALVLLATVCRSASSVRDTLAPRRGTIHARWGCAGGEEDGTAARDRNLVHVGCIGGRGRCLSFEVWRIRRAQGLVAQVGQDRSWSFNNTLLMLPDYNRPTTLFLVRLVRYFNFELVSSVSIVQTHKQQHYTNL